MKIFNLLVHFLILIETSMSIHGNIGFEQISTDTFYYRNNNVTRSEYGRDYKIFKIINISISIFNKMEKNNLEMISCERTTTNDVELIILRCLINDINNGQLLLITSMGEWMIIDLNKPVKSKEWKVMCLLIIIIIIHLFQFMMYLIIVFQQPFNFLKIKNYFNNVGSKIKNVNIVRCKFKEGTNNEQMLIDNKENNNSFNQSQKNSRSKKDKFRKTFGRCTSNVKTIADSYDRFFMEEKATKPKSKIGTKNTNWCRIYS